MHKKELAVVCPDCSSNHVKFVGIMDNDNNFAGKETTQIVGDVSLYRCKTCNLQFKFPILSQEKYNELYDNDVTELWKSDALRFDQAQVLEYIRYLHVGNILDYGCYTGGLLGKIPGNNKYGIEINTSAAKIASHVPGVQGVYRDISSLPENLTFDIVIAMDVIEHMTSPRKFLESLLDITTPNGIVIITSGDADNLFWLFHKENWWYSSFNEHIAFISKKWLSYYEKILNFTVLRVRKYRYEPISLSVLVKYMSRIIINSVENVLKFLHIGKGSFVENFLRKNNIDFKKNYTGFALSKDHLLVVIKKSL